LALSRSLFPFALAGLFFVAPAAHAASGVVIGDSLGVGISMASGLRNLAANSVSIRGSRVIEQIRQLSPGTVAFMSLGTNDAVGPVKGLEKSIDNVLQAARAARVTLVWIGPPCVEKAWDRNARELDAMLRERLAAAGVTYVSMRGEDICGPGLRAKDGVHFTMQGYKNMWARASQTARFDTGTQPPLAAVQPRERENRREQQIVQAGNAPVQYANRSHRDTSRFFLDFRWPVHDRFVDRFVPD